jgi:hypothetical protein
MLWHDGLALAWAGSCFPWTFIHQEEFLGHSFCSAWVSPPGDARQIAREPVSCDSSICMGLPIKGPMTGLVCACGVATLEFCWASLGDLWANAPCNVFEQVALWGPPFAWLTQTFSLFPSCYTCLYLVHTGLDILKQCTTDDECDTNTMECSDNGDGINKCRE